METNFHQLTSLLKTIKAISEVIEGVPSITISRLASDSLELLQKLGGEPVKHKGGQPNAVTLWTHYPIVLHQIGFWQQNDPIGGEGLFQQPFHEGTYQLGVDTFELTMPRIQNTLYCQQQLDKITGIGRRIGVDVEAIRRHAVGLWGAVMRAEEPELANQHMETYVDFIVRVLNTIETHLETQVDGIALFETNPQLT